MLRTNYLAFVAAVVVAFIFSSLYYGVLAQEMTKLHAAKPAVAAEAMAPAPWKVLVEVGRTITVVYVLALLVGRLGIDEWKGAVRLAVLLWIAFSFVMWVGAIIWENVPVKLAAIHAGDWLIKTTLIAVIVAVWRR
jgi:hypothetical protein